MERVAGRELGVDPGRSLMGVLGVGGFQQRPFGIVKLQDHVLHVLALEQLEAISIQP